MEINQLKQRVVGEETQGGTGTVAERGEREGKEGMEKRVQREHKEGIEGERPADPTPWPTILFPPLMKMVTAREF